nr:glycosyltransferase family 1 protein [uncultured Aminipila sp.]
MKVVINATQFKQRSSGIGVMTYHLFGRFIEQTEHEVVVILSKDSPEFPFDNGKTTIVRLPYDKGQSIKRNFFQSFIMGMKYCKNSVLLTTDAKIPFLLPKSCEVLPVITDLAVFRMGEVYKASRVMYWKMQYWFLKRKTEKYIAISEFTKWDLIDVLKIPEKKIDIVYCACDERIKKETSQEDLKLVKEKYDLPDKYVLFVGNFNPRKNLERTILAFDQMKNEAEVKNEITDLSKYKFVIVGEHGWKFSKQEALQNIKHKDDIIFTDYVEDEDMPAMYTIADAFIFPTLYEGFGIPIIESQRCETPVITSNLSAMPEVAGNGALFVNPENVNEISKKMTELLTDNDLAASLVEKGIKNYKRFNWIESGKKVNDIINLQKQKNK